MSTVQNSGQTLKELQQLRNKSAPDTQLKSKAPGSEGFFPTINNIFGVCRHILSPATASTDDDPGEEAIRQLQQELITQGITVQPSPIKGRRAKDDIEIRLTTSVTPATPKQTFRRSHHRGHSCSHMRRSIAYVAKPMPVDSMRSMRRCRTVHTLGPFCELKKTKGLDVEAVESLSTKVPMASKVFGDASGKGETDAKGKLHGPFGRVKEDDFGSVIAYALLCRQTQEAMVLQWGKYADDRVCPVARWAKERGLRCGSHPSGLAIGECDCYMSLPESYSMIDETLRGGVSGMSPASPLRNSMDPSQACSPLNLGPSFPQAADLLAQAQTQDFPKNEKLERFKDAKWRSRKEALRDLPVDAPTAPENPHEERWAQAGCRKVLTSLVNMPESTRKEDAKKEKSEANAIKVAFEDDVASYEVKIWHPAQYHIIRHMVFGDDLNFLRSLHRCSSVSLSGGKTKANFFTSHDKLLLLKGVGGSYEFSFLTEEMPSVFWYLDKVLFEKLPSVIVQILGLFSVEIKPKSGNNFPARKENLVVTRNLRHGFQEQYFDLKGVGAVRSAPNKATTAADGSKDLAKEQSAQHETVEGGSAEGPFEGTASMVEEGQTGDRQGSRTDALLDAEFLKWSEGCPLSMPAQDLRLLEAAVCNDTMMLRNLKAMDYSLFLSIAKQDESTGFISLGIIDYLRTFTFDKMLESAYKSWTRGEEPTIVAPPMYARRFLNACATYFAAVQ